MRKIEVEMLEENLDNSLMMNTATVNGSWNNKWNPNQNQVKEVSKKLSEAGKRANHDHKRHLIVVDGKLYKSYEEVERSIGVSVSTTHRRVHSDSPAFVNWYRAHSENDVRIVDERFVGIPHRAHIYEIEGNVFYDIKEIAEKYDITTETVSTLTKSQSFPEWKKHIG